MNERRENDLDRALTAGRDPSEAELATLVTQAQLLKAEFGAEPPAARHERALFVQGVAARKRSLRPVGLLVPAAVLATLLLVVAVLGRTAIPGQTLYGVREALATVGLARGPSEEIEKRIDEATAGLIEARVLVPASPGAAQSLVFEAIADLDRARAFVSDVSRAEAGEYLAVITRLEDRAAAIIVALDPGARTDAELKGGEDNSGPGSGEDSGDDNSGPGGGDDNSGPGGGDDSSGEGDGDDADERQDRREDARDEQQDREEDQRDEEQDALDDQRDGDSSGSGGGGSSGSDGDGSGSDGDGSGSGSSGSGDGNLDGDNSGSGSGDTAIEEESD